MKNVIYERNPNMDSIPYTSFGEALHYLENKGVATNIASFLGATTVRIHEVGYENRDATPEELNILDGINNTVTAANLNELTAGSGNTSLHSHASSGGASESFAIAMAVAL